MRQGGYKIIDLKKYNFTSATKVNAATTGLTGIYSAIESTNKRHVVSGLVVGGVEVDDFNALFAVESSSMVAIVNYGSKAITMKVDADDSVTITIA